MKSIVLRILFFVWIAFCRCTVVAWDEELQVSHQSWITYGRRSNTHLHIKEIPFEFNGRLMTVFVDTAEILVDCEHNLL